MNTLERINRRLDCIVNYYVKLKEQNNLLDFLKKEIKCINEGLNLIDLTILPLSLDYINEKRRIIHEALERDNFLEIAREQNNDVVNKIFKIKRFTNMGKHEQDVYDAFILLFPIGIESGDLSIEMFVDRILDCCVKEEDVLILLYKYFKEII
jgi:hypothetical protein